MERKAVPTTSRIARRFIVLTAVMSGLLLYSVRVTPVVVEGALLLAGFFGLILAMILFRRAHQAAECAVLMFSALLASSLLDSLAANLRGGWAQAASKLAAVFLIATAVCLIELGKTGRPGNAVWRRTVLVIALLAGMYVPLPLGVLGLALCRPGRWLPALDVPRWRWAVPLSVLAVIALLSIGPLLPRESAGYGTPALISAGSLVRGALVAAFLLTLIFPRGMRIRHKLVFSFLLNGVVPIILTSVIGALCAYVLLGALLSSTIARQFHSLSVTAQAAAEEALAGFTSAIATLDMADDVADAAARLSGGKWRAGLAVGQGTEILYRAGDLPADIMNAVRTGGVYYLAGEAGTEMWLVSRAGGLPGWWALAAIAADSALAGQLSRGIGMPVAISICAPNMFWRPLSLREEDIRALCHNLAWPANQLKENERIHLMGGGLLVSPIPEQDGDNRIVGSFTIYTNWRLLSAALTGNIPPGTNFMLSRRHVHVFGGSTDSVDPGETNMVNMVAIVLAALIASATLLMIIASIGLGARMTRGIGGGISRLRAGAERLQAQDLSARIPVVGRDELAELALVFNNMAESLEAGAAERERLIKEQVEQDRLREEVATARLIQRSFLPSADPQVEGISAAGFCRPAAEVGGDYYDYLPLDRERLGLVVGDVSGHGVPAGLLMAMAKSFLYNQIRVSDDVSAVMSGLNRMVFDALQRRLIMTLAYLVIDIPTGALRFASAGHHFPYILKPDGRLIVLEDVHYPLGVRKDVQYLPQAAALTPGDLLVLYSDGIVESLNPAGDPFGFDRFEAVLRGLGGADPQTVRDGVLQALDSHIGERAPDDDITLVVLAYHGLHGLHGMHGHTD